MSGLSGPPRDTQTERDGEQSEQSEEQSEEHEPDTFALEVTSLDGGTTRPHTLKSGPRRRWVRFAQAASVLAIVALLLVVLVLPHTTFSLSSTLSSFLPQPTATPLRYTGQPLACPGGATWSPDSQQIAVIHYLKCDRADPLDNTGGVLAIYDHPDWPGYPPASVIALDTLVARQGLPASVTHNTQEMRALRLAYTSIGWSPDGRTIALTYAGSYAPAARTPLPDVASDPRINGLLLLPVGSATGHVRVFNQPAPQPTYPLSPSAPYPVVAWNLLSGQQVVYTIPRSLAYRWNADDTLAATAPLSTTPGNVPTTAPGPVGDPVGGASFTLWQVGYISASNAACVPGPSSTQPASTDSSKPTSGNASAIASNGNGSYISLGLSTGGPVWSPDGVIFIPQGLYSGGRADVPFPASARDTTHGCSWLGAATDLPLVPIHDTALRTVLNKLTAASSVTLLWRPDGQRVVFQESPVTIQQSTGAQYTITVYDCATGLSLATPNTPGSLESIFGDPSMQWSPNGQRLLLVGYGEAPVTVLDAMVLGD